MTPALMQADALHLHFLANLPIMWPSFPIIDGREQQTASIPELPAKQRRSEHHGKSSWKAQGQEVSGGP